LGSVGAGTAPGWWWVQGSQMKRTVQGRCTDINGTHASPSLLIPRWPVNAVLTWTKEGQVGSSARYITFGFY